MNNNTAEKEFSQQKSDDFLVNDDDFKVRPKKSDSIKMAKLFRLARFDKQSANLYYCAKSIVVDGEFKLKRISSCRTRMCPVCDWRRSIKSHAVACKVFHELCNLDSATLDSLSRVNLVFITLTIRNCSADKLPETLDKLYSSWRRLIRTDMYKNAVLGSMRSIEITYNENTNTYHPHIHALLHCTDVYYYSDTYITHEHLKKYWQKALQVEYEPYVDIRPFKAANVKELNKSISEVTKYVVKTGNILRYSVADSKKADILETLFNSIFRRRLIAYQGDLRKIKHNLQLADEPTDETDTNSDLEYLFNWNFKLGKYEKVEENYGI